MSMYFGLEKDNFTFLSKNNVRIWVKLFYVHVETPLGTFTVKLKYKLHLNVIVTEKQKPHVLNHQSKISLNIKGLWRLVAAPLNKVLKPLSVKPL